MKAPWEQTKRDIAVGGVLFIVASAIGLYLTGSFRLSYAFGSCIGIFAFGIGLAAIRELRAALASRSWPFVSGCVMLLNFGYAKYPPRIEVSYEVDGRSYTCTRIAFGPSPAGRSMKRKLAEYPVGKQVTVYFDSRNPGNSVCLPGVNASFFWYLLCVAMGAYGGVLIFLQARGGR